MANGLSHSHAHSHIRSSACIHTVFALRFCGRHGFCRGVFFAVSWIPLLALKKSALVAGLSDKWPAFDRQCRLLVIGAQGRGRTSTL
jgi:hypothetical protein